MSLYWPTGLASNEGFSIDEYSYLLNKCSKRYDFRTSKMEYPALKRLNRQTHPTSEVVDPYWIENDSVAALDYDLSPAEYRPYEAVYEKSFPARSVRMIKTKNRC